MVSPALDSLPLRTQHALMIALTSFTILLSGCQRAEPPPPPVVEAEPVNTEVEETKQKLTVATNNVETKNAELAAAKTALDAAKTQLAERDVVVGKKDEQIKTLQAEIESLKKRDAFVFAEISAVQEQGQSVLALNRYQQFIKDFPKSPLVANATSAINELTVATEQEARRLANVIDPKSREREFLQQFEDGFLTLKELAPVLKNRTVAQVLGLLGPPNRIFGDGTEIGYVDKAIDPVTAKRGVFIIAFESGVVANIRVEYAGRRLVP